MSKRAKLFWFGYALLLAAWVVMQIHTIVTTHHDGKGMAWEESGKVHLNDFALYYAMGKIAVSHQRALAYDPNLQLDWINKIISPHHIEVPFFARYPPYLFTFLAPLALAPVSVAYMLLGVLTAAAAIWGLFVLSKHLNGTAWRAAVVLIFLGGAASAAGWLNMLLGQLGWMIAALVAAYFFFLIKGKDVPAGLTLALSTIKIQYSFLLLVPPLAEKRWKTLIAFAAAECALILVAAANLGWDTVLAYPHVLRYAGALPGTAPSAMVNVRGILSSLITDALAFKIAQGVFMLGVCLLFLLWKKCDLLNQLQTRWVIACTVLICLVASPHAHLHDELMLAVAVVATLPLLVRPGKSAVLKTWAIVLVLYPVISWLSFATVGRSPMALLNLVLLGLALNQFTSASRHSQSSAERVSE